MEYSYSPCILVTLASILIVTIKTHSRIEGGAHILQAINSHLKLHMIHSHHRIFLFRIHINCQLPFIFPTFYYCFSKEGTYNPSSILQRLYISSCLEHDHGVSATYGLELFLRNRWRTISIYVPIFLQVNYETSVLYLDAMMK